MYSQTPELQIHLYFGTQSAGMNATTSTFVQQLHEKLR